MNLGTQNIKLQKKGELVQADSYYPFGLTMNGLSYQALSDDEKNKYLYNGKAKSRFFFGKLQEDFDLDWFSLSRFFFGNYGARFYDPALGRWHTQDPLAEKYYNWSPLNYTMNNPIRFIDPNGMFVDDYTLDIQTGDVKLVKETNDNHDRIVKTDKNGNVKTKKNGESKVAIQNIEKGILSDGMNFKTDDNVIEVGGENQPSLGGVEDFLVKMSDYVGVENSGIYLSADGQKEISSVYIDEYKGNSFDNSKTSLIKQSFGNSNPRVHFHTHPTTHKSKYIPSRADKSFKKGNKSFFEKFIILTDHPDGPIEY